MKHRYLIFVVCILLLTSFCWLAPRRLERFVSGEAQVFFLEKIQTDCETTDLGDGCIVFCNTRRLKDLPQNYFALTVSLSPAFCASDLISKIDGKVIWEEQVGDIKILYGFSPRLVGGINIDGKKINFQIAVCRDKISVGCPLIAGEY